MMSAIIKQYPPYTAAHIANFILFYGKQDGFPIDNLKLQKLTYIFFGWMSAFIPKYPLYLDPIYAWKFGPVIKSLYNQYKHYYKDPIKYDDYAWIDTQFRHLFDNDKAEINIMNEEIYEILKLLWDKYKSASSGYLVDITHEKGGPWDKTYDGTLDKVIPVRIIQNYYKGVIEQIGK